MFFSELTNEEKKAVQKYLFRGTAGDYVAYSMIEQDGEIRADVMDFINSTEWNISESVYIYNDFELIDIKTNNRDTNKDNIVQNMIEYHERLDRSVFNYNYAMGLLNKEYQHEAEKYFESKAMDKTLSPIKRGAYLSHLNKLKDAYDKINAERLNNQNKKSKVPAIELNF